jgi:hypothetical protein
MPIQRTIHSSSHRHFSEELVEYRLVEEGVVDSILVEGSLVEDNLAEDNLEEDNPGVRKLVEAVEVGTG